jgi:hypothetical protein
MRNLLLLFALLIPIFSLAQPWSADGICDFTDGQQWNNGGAKGCACTWYTISGTDTILNCAFGDCGQNALFECVYDCNGHNGFSTQSIPRQCDATASPICWFNGAGSQGELFCQGLALPIELTDFWGVSTEEGNELYWTTATEMNNDYFEISYSSDGIDFEVLTKVDGAGTSSQELNYRFIHMNPKIGVGYYKIKQVDYDGAFEEFTTIAINNDLIGNGKLFSNIYPNPSEGAFFFNYNGKKFGIPIFVEILDNTGKVVISGRVDKFNNSQAISFSLDGIDSGSYQVRISQGYNQEMRSLMKI